MVRYQVILVYDGTAFHGFQRQVKAGGERARTVQGEFETALREMGWQGEAILAAGRTDSGVHAYGQVVAFDLEWRHGLQALQAALNSYLPPDMAVHALSEARPSFHPRYDAVQRRYQYRLFCQPVRHPVRERYSWRVWPAVVLDDLQAEALHLIGEHDFAAFGTPPRSGGSTIRTVQQARWFESCGSGGETDLAFEIAADAFLYHMVRRLVWAQVAAGQGKLPAGAIQHYLQSASTGKASGRMVQGMAPPQGLTLVEVVYSQPE